MQHRHSPQRGFFLIEALVAILIFSIGILGMVAIGGTAMGAQNDARFRTEAVGLATELASDIVLNVDRSTEAAFRAYLESFEHRPNGGNCAFGGANALVGNAVMQNWLNRVTTQGPGRPGLPGATAATQQVIVDTTPAGFNMVQISVCWQGPADEAMRQHVFVTYVNGLVE